MFSVLLDESRSFDAKTEIIKAEVIRGDIKFQFWFSPHPFFFNLHPALMLGIYEKVMCSLDNDFCLMFSNRQLHGNKCD